MKPPLFEMARPTVIEDALELLASHGPDARPLAGGQSLVPMMNLRMAAPTFLVDLARIESLRGIHVDGPTIRVGAMTRQADLLAHPDLVRIAPLLAHAMPNMGHVQTRNRGTIGGSLAHADPSAELALSMVALGAVMTIRSSRETRQVPARKFFVDVFTTDLAPDELLVEISWPVAISGTRASFREYARRHGDFALASAAAQLTPGENGPALACAIGGVGVTPHFCDTLCRAFDLQKYDVDLAGQLVDAELAQIDILSDLQADAPYRLRLARIALLDCLAEVFE